MGNLTVCTRAFDPICCSPSFGRINSLLCGGSASVGLLSSLDSCLYLASSLYETFYLRLTASATRKKVADH
ncbi:MAG: hypothetical protein ACREMY_13070 [bacterium]